MLNKTKIGFYFQIVFCVVLIGIVVAICNSSQAQSSPKKASEGASCIKCHEKFNKNIVNDWKVSVHSRKNVDCSTCHGTEHKTFNDTENVKAVTHKTCKKCHKKPVENYEKGKHALAWMSQLAMPTNHMKPSTLIDGMKGCGGCHKIGIKSESEIKRLRKNGAGFGMASCDGCHTRHTFSKKEAQQPQVCQTCHMGFDHPQWEMFSSSKHGVRSQLVQNGSLPSGTTAPACQACHMPNGNHGVRTAWGFYGIRMDKGISPYPGEDKEWWNNRVTILQGMGFLDPEGKPTSRFNVVKDLKIASLTKKEFDTQREKMINNCGNCHSKHFAKSELEKGDKMIREVDKLMAEAIRIVALLYKDKVLIKPDNYNYEYPDLLTFHDAPTPIEQRLFNMFLSHRMRAFQGVFHSNPSYAFWYGWSEMKQDLSFIKTEAKRLRKAMN